MTDTLTRAEVMAWNYLWSDADRATITEQLNRLNATEFEVIPSGKYIKCHDRTGKLVMRVHPGSLEFPPMMGPRHADPYPHSRTDTDVCYLPLTTNKWRFVGDDASELAEQEAGR